MTLSISTAQAFASAPKAKILVVEDDFINQQVVTSLLDCLGYEADVACNGQEALDMYSNDYSLILMDLGLPDIDGYTVCKELKSNYNTDIPILALTASCEQVNQKCLDAGMEAVLGKPLLIEVLKCALERWLH